MRYSFLLLLFLVFSCEPTRKTIRSRENIENLKQMAYCDCLTFSINRFVGKDSIDGSYSEVMNKTDFSGEYYFVKKIYPLLDSASKSIMLTGLKYQYGEGRAEGANGLVDYKINCLNFYKSKGLDSLVRVLSKRINDSIYIDPVFNMFELSHIRRGLF